MLTGQGIDFVEESTFICSYKTSFLAFLLLLSPLCSFMFSRKVHIFSFLFLQHIPGQGQGMISPEETDSASSQDDAQKRFQEWQAKVIQVRPYLTFIAPLLNKGNVKHIAEILKMLQCYFELLALTSIVLW